jgi:hypothetical protein
MGEARNGDTTVNVGYVTQTQGGTGNYQEADIGNAW